MNKQIEEMAKIIDKAQKRHNIHCEKTRQCDICEYHKGKVRCSSNHIAEDLFNESYRKVTDNYVLIEKSFLDEHYLTNKEFVEDVLKETAKEILQKVYDEFAMFTDDSIYDGGEIKAIIRTIAKRNGVEVL